jgi:hypothetical protein
MLEATLGVARPRIAGIGYRTVVRAGSPPETAGSARRTSPDPQENPLGRPLASVVVEAEG